MPRFLLDTNTVSYALKGNPPKVRECLRAVPVHHVCISAITEAELLAGLALKPEATRLAALVNRFLLSIAILPWESAVAKSYAMLFLHSRKRGRSLSTIDLLVAAHAHAIGATLVTSDRAFRGLRPVLSIVDWSDS